MPEHNADAIKRLMDEELLTSPDGRHGFLTFFKNVVKGCQSRDIPFLPEVVFGYWWHLVGLGAVVPVRDLDVLGSHPTFDAFLLGGRGRRLLESGAQSPHDPSRYIQAVRSRVTHADAIALVYLDEAVRAWGAGLYRCSAVMLGGACERLVLILAERITETGTEPWARKIGKALGGNPVRVSSLFDLIRQCFNDLKGKKQLPAPLADAVDRKLSAVFDHARGLRNRSGHPTAREVSAEDAEAGLLLFPGFYALVNDFCEYLRRLRPDPSA